jgi:uncharacterized protein YndB with AHSA1/START domain
MTTLHHDVIANCPPERVWALLADLEAVQQYNPTVRAASIEGPRRTGIGAIRSCDGSRGSSRRGTGHASRRILSTR